MKKKERTVSTFGEHGKAGRSDAVVAGGRTDSISPDALGSEGYERCHTETLAPSKGMTKRKSARTMSRGDSGLQRMVWTTANGKNCYRGCLTWGAGDGASADSVEAQMGQEGQRVRNAAIPAESDRMKDLGGSRQETFFSSTDRKRG